MTRPRPYRELETWRTVHGLLTVVEMTDAVSAFGVRLDRARLTYWQSEAVFPLPEVRYLGRAGSVGLYHSHAVALARMIDVCLERGLPYRPPRRRSSVAPLRWMLSAWRHELASEGDVDAAVMEDRFYQKVRVVLGRVLRGESIAEFAVHPTDLGHRVGNGQVGRRSLGAPRRGDAWRLLIGELDSATLEQAVRRRGVEFSRTRKLYWQRAGVFPYGAGRTAARHGSSRGRHTYFPGPAADLAVVVDYCLALDHPAKSGPWKWSPVALATVLATWRSIDDPYGDIDGELAFFERIARLASQIEDGLAPVELVPTDVVDGAPSNAGEHVLGHEHLVGLGELAAEWLHEHPAERAHPPALIAWFRLERVEADWRVSSHGVRAARRPGSGSRPSGVT